MAQQILLTRTHLENALTPALVRINSFIRSAIIAGVLLFTGVLFVLWGTWPPSTSAPADFSLINILSLTNACAVFLAMIFTLAASRLILTRSRLDRPVPPATAEEASNRVVSLYRIYSLVLIVPLEGSSFFALAVCLTGILNSFFIGHPEYWLNILPVIFFLAAAIKTFPTKMKTLETLEAQFL